MEEIEVEVGVNTKLEDNSFMLLIKIHFFMYILDYSGLYVHRYTIDILRGKQNINFVKY